MQSHLIFVFPGQGSQKKGMGEGLFERFPEITREADFELGYSIRELCLADPRGELNRTEFTQPALYTVNALTYQKVLAETGTRPHAVAGHSLGEYNALLAAGAFDFRTGLKLVKRRGELMARATGGGMAAVVGLTEAQVKDVLLRAGFLRVSIANLNAPQQTVISGPRDDILALQSHFESAGVRLYLPLNVSGAFHSPFMQPARDEMAALLNTFAFRPLELPVISNVEAAPYKNDQIAALLARQITSPVRWVETVRYFLKLANPTFKEIGPGNVLTGLIRQCSL